MHSQFTHSKMAGEMVWIKQLLAKYEDQSLAFEDPHKCQVGYQSACDFSLRQRQYSWASWLARPATSQLWAWLRALAAVNKVEKWLAVIPPSGSTCMRTYLINQEIGKGKLQWLSNQHILLPAYVRMWSYVWCICMWMPEDSFGCHKLWLSPLRHVLLEKVVRVKYKPAG